MKRFVTTLILMVSVMFLFVQCVGDPGYTTVYIYKNTTDYPIQIDLYGYNYGYGDFKLVKTYRIESNDELKINLSGRGRGFIPPFKNNGSLYKAIITSNNVQIVETVKEPNSLLNESVYSITTNEKDYRIYEFTFTDAYFANGTPVTP